MTIKTLTHVLIGVLVAGSAAAALQVTDRAQASAPVSSARILGTESITSERPVFLRGPAVDRIAANSGGLKLTPFRITP